MKPQEFIVQPIGHVRVERGSFTIEIEEQYRPALAGLDGFGHINVLWWADRCHTPEQRRLTICKKPYTHGPDRIGIFATRTPQRPNPVAVTIAAVISVDQNAVSSGSPTSMQRTGRPLSILSHTLSRVRGFAKWSCLSGVPTGPNGTRAALPLIGNGNFPHDR